MGSPATVERLSEQAGRQASNGGSTETRSVAIRAVQWMGIGLVEGSTIFFDSAFSLCVAAAAVSEMIGYRWLERRRLVFAGVPKACRAGWALRW